MKTDFLSQLVALMPRLRRFAIGLTADVEEADDLLQSAYEKALTKQHQWQPDSRLDSWMYRIIQTTRIDSLRRSRNDAVTVDDATLNAVTDEKSECRAENEDLLRKTLAVLDQLPEEQRSVMLLIVIEGYSYAEVAQLLEIPTGTVMSRLCRARIKLQTLIGHPVPADKG